MKRRDVLETLKKLPDHCFAKLPSFSVKGDEIDAYLLAFNPLKLGRAATIRKTPVRVVCHNTLQASGYQFSAEWRVCHTKDAVAQLESFLKNMWAQAVSEYETVAEFYSILAGCRLSDDEAKDAIAKVYEQPAMPKGLESLAVSPTEEGAAALAKLASWEREKGAAIEHRSKTFALYGGDGRGSQSEAAKGTTRGVYNAVVEYEQHLKRFRQPQSVVFGAGRDRIIEAYNVCAEIAGLETEPEKREVAAS
jgi:hypothetical protein